jgi:CRISPR-associated protein Cmr3
MLARQGIDPTSFAAGTAPHPTLGTPQNPGTFAVVDFTLARRDPDGIVESLHVLPADLVAESGGDGDRVARLLHISPIAPPPGLQSSAPMGCWPVLPQGNVRSKPVGGLWLTQAGWAEYLAGRTPAAGHIVTSASLWALETRVGVGLDTASRRAADGQLFTVQAVAFHRGVGFIASVAGAEPPSDGVLRLGGDGRGAALRPAHHKPSAPDLGTISRSRRTRVVLTTPALLPEGWLLPGVSADRRIEWPGLSARLACAAVPRAEVVSGWDLAQRQPKPAERAAPAGSVYWLDELDATPEALGKLAECGLWLGDHQNAHRRAEGFNRFTFAAW